MIVGDLVEWLGQALEKAAEAQQPVSDIENRRRSKGLRDGLRDGYLMRALCETIGVEHVETLRSPVDRGYRIFGKCKCGQRFWFEFDEDIALWSDARAAAQLLLLEMERARDRVCHCVVLGSVPQ